MRNGIKILGTVTNKCFVKQEGEKRFRIILTQGLNRQIRRMCAALGYKVTSLKRVRIMNITLNGLAPGKWRNFSAEEIAEINAMVSKSSKTADSESMGEWRVFFPVGFYLDTIKKSFLKQNYFYIPGFKYFKQSL